MANSPKKLKQVGSALTLPNSNVPTVPDGWADKFAQYVEKTRSASDSFEGWDWISSKGGTFQYMESLIGKELEVIVLGATRENQHYQGEYDPTKPGVPDCWALDGTQGEGEPLQPTNVPEPWSDVCEGCQKNEWGSGKRRGKACRNYVRLAMVRANDPSGSGLRFRIPPTGVGAWSKFAKKLENGLGRPLFSVVTKLVIKPKGGSFTVVPELISFVNDEETLEVLASRVEEANVELLRVFEPREDDDAPKEQEESAGAAF